MVISCSEPAYIDIPKGITVDRPIKKNWGLFYIFQNPWPEWRSIGATLLRSFRMLWFKSGRRGTSYTKEELNREGHSVIDTEIDRLVAPVPPGSVRYTWIGHASCLIQLPGLNVLCDPIFGQMGGLAGYLTPRVMKAPFTIEDMNSHGLKLDAIVISHNHYDHLDVSSLQTLFKTYGREVVFAVPLQMKSWLHGKLNHIKPVIGKASDIPIIVECDWWQSFSVGRLSKELQSPESNPLLGTAAEGKITCVPAQHWCLRTDAIYCKSLWSGWVFEAGGKRVYFAGDTGYNTRCFKSIGHVFADSGPFAFDLAAIPIGCYCPDFFMQPQHCSPSEACLMHTELKARRSVAIHWGTFDIGSKEPFLEPAELLKAAATKEGVDFTTTKIGEIIETSDEH